MSRCDQKYQVVSYFFDELTKDEKKAFGAHLADCGICQEHLAALDATSQITRRQQRAKPAKALLRHYHLQLEKQFATDRNSSRLVDRILDQLIRRPALPIRLAEALVLILIGFFLGKMTIEKPGGIPESLFTNAAPSYAQEESVLLKNYLQQTEMVLLDVKNLDPIDDQELILNLIQSAKYRYLLQKTLLLREQAKDSDDQQLSQLLNKIELILLELDNLETNGYIETLLLIKKQLKETHLLLEIKSLNQMDI